MDTDTTLVGLDPLEKRRMLELADSWLRKADRENDAFDRYISLFVAYNVLYNLVALQSNPRADLTTKDGQRAVDATRAIPDKADFIRELRPFLVDYLSMIPVFKEEFWGKNPISKKLHESLEVDDSAASLSWLVKWLYKVRCNVFHGVKKYGDEKQEELLEKSCRLLRVVIQRLRIQFQIQDTTALAK